ncbi:MAG: leucyl aminopeptidase [Proteobacteria bacterium]|nr:leucyl aminopeptidase [Pseudomonadota bacterium]
MKILLSSAAPLAIATDLLALGVPGGKPGKDPAVTKLDRLLGGALTRQIADDDFSAKRGQTLLCSTCGVVPARRILLVGLGEEAGSQSGARQLGARAGLAARSLGSLHVVAPDSEDSHIGALVDGILTGSYRFTRYLTGERLPKQRLAKACILVQKATAAMRRSVQHGVAVGEAVNLVRDLVNTPPNDLYPASFAAAARKAADAAGVRCRILDRKQLAQLGARLMLAVSQGSSKQPRLIHLSYNPRRRGAAKVALVGKGLTFDSGGLCLKPADAMVDMKCDMSGGAVTLATVVAAARLRLPVEVHGIIGAVENMNGADAYRPGDVLKSMEGKTVEVINTDAEGRLVLADVLTYARKLVPDYLVDHATLTGACMVALGNQTAGVFGPDDALASSYLRAAQQVGESMWRLPLSAELKDSLRSHVADLKHTGSRYGGAITAALFLQEFAGNSRWLHVDIAGPAFLSGTQGIQPKGGTGFGVLTALQFLKDIAVDPP